MPWDVLRDLRPYARPYLGRMVLVLGLTLTGVVSESLGLALLIPLLNLVFGVSGAIEPGLVTGSLTRFLLAFDPSLRLIVALTTIAGLTFLKSLASYAAGYLTEWIRYRLVQDLRVSLQRTLLGVAYRFVTGLKSGDIMFAFGTEANYIGIFVAHVFKFVSAALTATIFLSLMLSISWPLTLLAIGFAGLIGWAVQFSVRQTRERAKRLTQAEAELQEAAHQSWGAMRLARSLGTEAREVSRMVERAAATFWAVLRKARFFTLTLPLSEFIGALGLIAIIWFGARGALATTPAEIFGLTLIIVRLLPYVSSLNQTRSQLAADSHYARRLLRLVDTTDKPQLTSGDRRLSRLGRGIEFHNVSFRYPDRPESVLAGLRFTIPAGRTTAIVGASGSGKSTLLDLILRLYDPTSGAILVDGQDLKALDLQSWHGLVGVVSQESFIFNATVRENILYGKPTASERDLMIAAKRAYADEFIQQLPQRYETAIGDCGVLLSGGQRQRIAIARAIIRDPQLLIFDEATSALDRLSEAAVQRSIRELARDRTIVIVAHRVSTIEDADHIIVLAGGGVAEVGRHGELLQRQGVYARLYRMPVDDRS